MFGITVPCGMGTDSFQDWAWGLAVIVFCATSIRFLPVQLIRPDRVRARPEPHEVCPRERLALQIIR